MFSAHRGRLSPKELATFHTALYKLKARFENVVKSSSPSGARIYSIYSQAKALEYTYHHAEPLTNEFYILENLCGLSGPVTKLLIERLQAEGIQLLSLDKKKLGLTEASKLNKRFDEALLYEKKLQFEPTQQILDAYRETMKHFVSYYFCFEEARVERNAVARLGNALLALDEHSEWSQAVRARIEQGERYQSEVMEQLLESMFQESTLQHVKTVAKQEPQPTKAGSSTKQHVFDSPSKFSDFEMIENMLEPEKRSVESSNQLVTALADNEIVPEYVVHQSRTAKKKAKKLANPVSSNFRLVFKEHAQQRFDERFMPEIYGGEENWKALTPIQRDEKRAEFANRILTAPSKIRKPLKSFGGFAPSTWSDATVVALNGRNVIVLHDVINDSIQVHRHPPVQIRTIYSPSDSYLSRRLGMSTAKLDNQVQA